MVLSRGRHGGVKSNDDADRQVALMLRCAGWTIKEIGHELGVSERIVNRWFHTSGMTVINPGRSPLLSNTDTPAISECDLLDVSYQTSTSKVGHGRSLTGFDRVYIAFWLDSGDLANSRHGWT